MSKIIVQIYEVKSVEDAKMVVKMGVDHVGVPCGLPRFISYAQARVIFEAIGDKVIKVGLTVSNDAEEMIQLVTVAKPDILHLSGDIEKFSPLQISELRIRVKGLKVMQALPANDPNIYKFVRDYEPVSDYFLIDTSTIGAGDIGATGLTHDLRIDKQIVEMTRVPCIIAGGLGAENVAEAIKMVQPFGVDSMTKTNLDEPQGNLTKDAKKVKDFVQAVRMAEKEF